MLVGEKRTEMTCSPSLATKSLVEPTFPQVCSGGTLCLTQLGLRLIVYSGQAPMLNTSQPGFDGFQGTWVACPHGLRVAWVVTP